MITQIKVASSSSVFKVAGAISNIMRNQNYLDISTVGAGSLNQAIKAIAIARGFLIPSGIDIYIIPSFKDIMIGDKEKTAIKIRIEKK
ncbi:MAG: stage V sporulation protein S [Bacilli bacterium]|nr:stage V sporulation protein S [Erysipelotrichaceae bacterium]MDD7381544.1 stage V sporulation protein S [Bacillales bacterium]MDY2746240.1 stage V sporulation protein S [Bacilli bacterium]MDY3890385.1 stage V sporulation protein S [Bacilli bacterium]MDY6141937.1 stage V sporulation protein S [Bacilli bacterium]